MRASSLMTNAETSLDWAWADQMHEQLQDDHDAQQALCLELEQIADMLPALPPPARIRRICAQIEGVSVHHFPRAEAIFEDFAAQPGSQVTGAMLRTLSKIQAIDAAHGQDLIATLWDDTARGKVGHPGELGYMLRCFFDGCRRAIAFKEVLAMVVDCGDRRTSGARF